MISSPIDITLAGVIDNTRQAAAIIDSLHQQGYNQYFKLTDTRLKCVESNRIYNQLQFSVDQIHRIDGGIMSDNGYTVFALSHRTEDLKGIFIAI